MTLSLTHAQNNFIDTINNGPDKLDPTLFAGPPDRILLGLKAHANTISHARIVALEETFPLTRQQLGDVAFNALAREFVEAAAARACDANRIGLGFPHCLSDPAMRDLAQIEWAWLESYNAAEAAPMTMGELAALDEAALLAFPVASHPSARIVEIFAPIAAALQELVEQQPVAILCVRPDAEVRLVPLDAVQFAVFAASVQKSATLGNLLAVALEQAGEQAPLEPILHLIGAGALIKTG
jgi:Putative DNA-binding domain